MDYTVV